MFAIGEFHARGATSLLPDIESLALKAPALAGGGILPKGPDRSHLADAIHFVNLIRLAEEDARRPSDYRATSPLRVSGSSTDSAERTSYQPR